MEYVKLLTPALTTALALLLGFLYARARYTVAKLENIADRAEAKAKHYLQRNLTLKDKMQKLQKELTDAKTAKRKTQTTGELVSDFNKRVRRRG